MLFVFINIVQLFPATKRYYPFLPCNSTCFQIFSNTPGTSRVGCKIQRFSFEWLPELFQPHTSPSFTWPIPIFAYSRKTVRGTSWIFLNSPGLFFSFHTSISCRDLNGKILLLKVYPHLRIKRWILEDNVHGFVGIQVDFISSHQRLS